MRQSSWVKWHTFLIPALKRWMQVDFSEFVARLGYNVLHLPGLHSETMSQETPKSNRSNCFTLAYLSRLEIPSTCQILSASQGRKQRQEPLAFLPVKWLRSWCEFRREDKQKQPWALCFTKEGNLSFWNINVYGRIDWHNPAIGRKKIMFLCKSKGKKDKANAAN